MPHKREIEHYEGQIDQLAAAVGRLTYDRLGAFVCHLAEELASQAAADMGRGRSKLARQLTEAAAYLQAANVCVDEAWNISAPHMTPEERGETVVQEIENP